MHEDPPGETVADSLLAASWLPVAKSADVMRGAHTSAHFLGTDVVLWRDASDAIHAWADRCPHRGARLSLGRVVDDTLRCPYHGWRFAPDARCVHWPAHPNAAPPAVAAARAFHVTERYGLVWVAFTQPAVEIPAFAAFDSPGRRSLIDGPYDFAACAPRVVENFLDMAHFPYVHAGTLGSEPHTEVKDYEVIVDEREVRSRGCRFFQPQPSGVAAGGAEAEYEYRVAHPTVASLAKLPGRPDAFEILLATTPLDEFNTRVWKVNVFADCDDDRAAQFGRFSRAAVLQDQPIVESQRPRRMPLDPRAELHQRADRLSAAYRRWLRDRGLVWGVTP